MLVEWSCDLQDHINELKFYEIITNKFKRSLKQTNVNKFGVPFGTERKQISDNVGRHSCNK